MGVKHFKLAAAAIAAALFATEPAATSPAAAGDNPDRDQERSNRAVYQIDIEDDEGRHNSIRRLIVVGDGPGRVAKTRHGIGRRDQNRIDYSGVPFVGQFSEPRYDKDDFTPGRRVGEVRAVGDDLVLLLDAGAEMRPDQVERIAVLNKDFAYETRRRPGTEQDASRERWADRGRVVGDVYVDEGDRLLALVRPFVVTDSAFW